MFFDGALYRGNVEDGRIFFSKPLFGDIEKRIAVFDVDDLLSVYETIEHNGIKQKICYPHEESEDVLRLANQDFGAVVLWSIVDSSLNHFREPSFEKLITQRIAGPSSLNGQSVKNLRILSSKLENIWAFEDPIRSFKPRQRTIVFNPNCSLVAQYLAYRNNFYLEIQNPRFR